MLKLSLPSFEIVFLRGANRKSACLAREILYHTCPQLVNHLQAALRVAYVPPQSP